MEKSARFDYWYEQYFLDAVKIETLNRLTSAGKLRKDEVDKMIADRLEKYGY